jgi:hypothetical protein
MAFEFTGMWNWAIPGKRKNLALAIPMHRMISSRARDFIAPKRCSTRNRVLDFSRLFAFCSSVKGRF